jgi:putative transposase
MSIMLLVRNFKPEIHHRRSIRLKGFDYSRPGYYFITLCCYSRECLFGEINEGKMMLNEYGKIARDEWVQSANIRREIELDEFVIMPNHFHAIVKIIDIENRCDRRGDRPVAPTEISQQQPVAPTEISQQQPVAPTEISKQPPVAPTEISQQSLVAPTGPKPESIGSLIAGFKSSVTTKINQLRNKPGEPVWQRNYYERIIRDDKSLKIVRYYIVNNPYRWRLDEFYR